MPHAALQLLGLGDSMTKNVDKDPPVSYSADAREFEAELRQSIKEGLAGAVISMEESLLRVRSIAQAKSKRSSSSTATYGRGVRLRAR